MKYELAKQLKEAGFPQDLDNPYRFDFFNNPPTRELVIEDNVYYPTLSELIEACGDKFWGILKNDGSWQADSVEPDWVEIGDTPEEAVAKLWLELNKK